MSDLSIDEIIKRALELDNIKKFVSGEPKKTIFACLRQTGQTRVMKFLKL